MEQYISKSAVKAEIDRLCEEHTSIAYCDDIALVLEDLEEFIDTLEVKEIDLEDSIKESLAQKYIDYTFKRHNIDPESRYGQLLYYAYMHGMNQCLDKLNAQKGE